MLCTAVSRSLVAVTRMTGRSETWAMALGLPETDRGVAVDRAGVAVDRAGERDPGARAPVGLRREGQSAAVQSDEGRGDGEAEAGTARRLLGREEGIAHAREVLGRDAGPLVLHLQHHAALALVEPRPDAHAPIPARQRLQGVEDQVHHDLLDVSDRTW